MLEKNGLKKNSLQREAQDREWMDEENKDMDGSGGKKLSRQRMESVYIVQLLPIILFPYK